MALRLTSTLNETLNDTGRTVFCGPTIVSAITGTPVSRIEEEIWRHREKPRLAANDCRHEGQITGTNDREVRAALAAYGYEMVPHQDFTHLERKARPSLLQWMQKPRNAWVHHVIGLHKGKIGHWIVVKGVMQCDTYSGGKWQFVVDGPHKGARLMDVHIVRKLA